MMDLSDLGKWLIIAGLGLAIVGGILWALGRVPFLGNLPGDIRIGQGSFGCFLPFATMLLLSVIATIVLNILLRIFRK